MNADAFSFRKFELKKKAPEGALLEGKTRGAMHEVGQIFVHVVLCVGCGFAEVTITLLAKFPVVGCEHLTVDAVLDDGLLVSLSGFHIGSLHFVILF